jgi:hypothetical protein
MAIAGLTVLIVLYQLRQLAAAPQQLGVGLLWHLALLMTMAVLYRLYMHNTGELGRGFVNLHHIR